MSGYYNGDEWRWSVRALESRGFRRGPTSVYVIEQPPAKDGEEEPEPKLKVPFGFGVREPCPERTEKDGEVFVCRRYAGHKGKHEPREPVGDEGYVDMPLLWEGDGA